MNRELRMYGLTPYQLSGIQSGIQFGHGVVEYGLEYFNDERYQKWAKEYKTFIILNGGTSNHSQNRYSNTEYIGTMEQHLSSLIVNNIKVSAFYEPDLNDMLSAIVFIVDERVFLKEKYPDFKFQLNQTDLMNPSFICNEEKVGWNKWVEFIGGESNLFLRTFLPNFKLA